MDYKETSVRIDLFTTSIVMLQLSMSEENISISAPYKAFIMQIDVGFLNVLCVLEFNEIRPSKKGRAAAHG